MPTIPECPCQVDVYIGSCYELGNFCMSCSCDACDYARRLQGYCSRLFYYAVNVPTFKGYSPQIRGDVFGFIQSGINDVVCERLAKPTN